jgi:hypothetical protein
LLIFGGLAGLAVIGALAERVFLPNPPLQRCLRA